ncbi:MAG: FAD:protein FMN transferase [Oscillospiraceae bacterium]|nr:FAD:protein FMN transferase [Oscillospiraceae bacterium]
MKRIISLLVLAALLLSGCAGRQTEKKQYQATFLTLFDTVTSIVGRADSEEAFRQTAQSIHDELLEYHQLFDIYNDYDGVANLKTINDNAGLAPVKVDGRILALLKDCKTYYEATGGKVNVAMGSVLRLWHEAREDGINDPVHAYLPDRAKLEAAAEHMDLSAVIVDEAASTVFITDPQVRLDVGAIAKGWSVQQVCASAPSGLLISVGGNVCATGPKDETGTPWVVAVQNPDGGDEHLHTLYLSRGSMVTSGDYQRAYVVDGELYHHIIDPNTLYPSTQWRSVTIVCPDSGLADALSTALFVLSLEEGQKLLEQFDAKAMWVDREGNRFYSPEFENLIRT